MTIAGRYVLGPRIASGGMATVYLGQAIGAVGFTRSVAIKRLHQQYAREQDFVSMLIDEARLAATIRHPNVVPTLDVVADGEELFVIMEYVEGASLSRALSFGKRKGIKTPVDVCVRIVCDLLYGLDAAHEAVDAGGEPLGVVHRDVSPQNLLVGTDGVCRVIDFGIAKAAGRVQVTREGQIKGKLAFMAPEQLLGKELDRRADIYGAAVVLWELLAGERLFSGENAGQLVASVVRGIESPPSRVVPGLPQGLDDVVMKALAVNRENRFSTAREFALVLEDVAPPARPRAVAEWLKSVGAVEIAVSRSGEPIRSSQAPPAMSASAPPPSFGPSSVVETPANDGRVGQTEDDGPAMYAPQATSNSLRLTREQVLSVLSGPSSSPAAKIEPSPAPEPATPVAKAVWPVILALVALLATTAILYRVFS